MTSRSLLTLDYVAERLRDLNPTNERICETSDTITSRYKHRLQKLVAPDQTPRLLSYMYTEDTTTPIELKRWYSYADLYLDRLGEHIQKIIMEEKEKIQDHKDHIENIIIQKQAYQMITTRQTILDTISEKSALSRINHLPEDMQKIIHSYMMTPQVRLIITKVDLAILQKVQNKWLKGFLKELKRRAYPLLLQLRKYAIYAVNYLRHSDIASLENIHGSGTKQDMLIRIEKTIACYEYCITIIQHKISCESLVQNLINELLYIYRACKYINVISKRKG
jgi:hypothetical protein